MGAKFSKMDAQGSGFWGSPMNQAALIGEFHFGLSIPFWVQDRMPFLRRSERLVFSWIQNPEYGLE